MSHGRASGTPCGRRQGRVCGAATPGVCLHYSTVSHPAARKMRKFVGIYKRMTEKSNKMTREEEMEEREKIIAEITELLKDADEEALRFIRSFLKAA